jgi:hypothetical protein
MPTCPAGHDSRTTDHCDQCGRAIPGAAPDVAGVAPDVAEAAPDVAEAAPDEETCPNCGTTREDRFCENCGHAFDGTPAVAAPAPWTAVVTADRAFFELMCEGGDPIEFPDFHPDRRVPLTARTIRIGRRSASRHLEPEIDLSTPSDDPGVSREHAELHAQHDGLWALIDKGSKNGTFVNGSTDPIPTHEPVTLGDGDRIQLGFWSTITLQRGS